MLDRIPPYAAVSSTVELARQAVGDRRAAFVNAVLRKSASGASPAMHQDPDTAEGLATRYSHPAWLVRRWTERYGLDLTRRILELDNRNPELVLQPLRISRAQLVAALEKQDIDFTNPGEDSGLRIKGAVPWKLPGYRQGWFHIQGPAQARLVKFADVPAGATLWDACAAPGGKSVPLSLTVRLFASDRSLERLRLLRDNLQRSTACAFTFVADALAPPTRKAFDVVWLDVPCTGTGVLGANPDARWRLSTKRMEQLVRLQRNLLESGRRFVKQDGLLIYTTCSLEPEENTLQVDAFLDRHPEFRRTKPDLDILPTETGADGGYGARMVRE